ncbi:uncharacterized protein [Periplaneta americana]
MTTSEPSSSTSTPTTTTETSTDGQITSDKSEEDKGDIFESEAMKVQEEEEKEEVSKSKRTIERNLGYGFNDIGSNRLNRQSDGKFRNYFSQPAAQQAHPYQHVRYYSSVRTAGTPQQDFVSRQAEQGHRPYSTISPSAVPQQSATSFNHAPATFPAGSAVDSATPEPVYFGKPSYQQVSAYRGPNNGAHVFSSSGSSHTAPLFSGPPPHAPTFYSGHSLASAHNPFATAPSHNVPNPFLSGLNFQGGPILYQHPGSSGLALLQNPSGHFGPQILPVIILRVGGGDTGNPYQHQGAVSPSFLQGLNLQTLLYPVQQYQAPQHTVFTPADAGQTPQFVYQDTPSSEAVKTQYQTGQQKVSYTSAQQKKPLASASVPSQNQKQRKNVVVLSEAGAQSDNSYTQYKYDYKDKA